MSKTKEQLELEQLVNELFEKHSPKLAHSFIKCVSDMSTKGMDVSVELYDCTKTIQNESTNR